MLSSSILQSVSLRTKLIFNLDHIDSRKDVGTSILLMLQCLRIPIFHMSIKLNFVKGIVAGTDLWQLIDPETIVVGQDVRVIKSTVHLHVTRIGLVDQ